jgi:hypothetical protein
MLSRRSIRSLDIPRAASSADLTEVDALPAVTLAELPAGLRRMSTSINESAGEIGAALQPSRRGLVVVTSFLVAIALAGGGVLLFSRGANDAPAPASQPHDEAANVEEMETSAPPPAEPPKPEHAVKQVEPDPAPAAAASSTARTPVKKLIKKPSIAKSVVGSKPDDKKPDDKKPDDKKLDEKKPDEKKRDKKPDEKNPDEKKPDEKKRDKKPDDVYSQRR